MVKNRRIDVQRVVAAQLERVHRQVQILAERVGDLEAVVLGVADLLAEKQEPPGTHHGEARR